jgi:hypothetical protein
MNSWTSHIFEWSVTWSVPTRYGVARLSAVARDVDNRHRGMVCGFSEEVQQELGILAIPFKQRAMDYLGHP